MTPYNNWGAMPQPSNNLWVGNNYTQRPMPYTSLPASNVQQPLIPHMNNVLRVMGVESAKEYQIGPDSQVILMDVSRPVFYMKRSDDSGYSEVRAFEFKEIPLDSTSTASLPTSSNDAPSLYLTREEFLDFKRMIEDLVMNNEQSNI